MIPHCHVTFSHYITGENMIMCTYVHKTLFGIVILGHIANKIVAFSIVQIGNDKVTFQV